MLLLTTFLGLVLALLMPPSMAQLSYPLQSKPFYLQLQSRNPVLNGQFLTPYHAGAAIEVFGLASNATQRERYYLNSSNPDAYGNAPTNNGVLNWNLVISNNFTVPSSVVIQSDLSSNVAVPYLYPGSDRVTIFNFDAGNYMYIQGGIDDTVKPLNQTRYQGPLYRFVVCQTYTGYLYTTLAWVLGSFPPENPSCQNVLVKRIWAQ